jgi:hypothetical protein
MKVRDSGKKTGSNRAMCGGVAAVAECGKFAGNLTVHVLLEIVIFLESRASHLSWYIAKDNK